MDDIASERLHTLGHVDLLASYEPEHCPFCAMLAAAPDKAKNLRDYRDAFGGDDPRARAAFACRRAEVLAEEEAAGESGLWYLSFIDPAIAATLPLEEQEPGGKSFLGACYVEAGGYIAAVGRAHELGINPGGQVAGWGPWPLEWASHEWRAAWCDRLLSRDEALTMPKMDRLPPDAS